MPQCLCNRSGIGCKGAGGASVFGPSTPTNSALSVHVMLCMMSVRRILLMFVDHDKTVPIHYGVKLRIISWSIHRLILCSAFEEWALFKRALSFLRAASTTLFLIKWGKKRTSSDTRQTPLGRVQAILFRVGPLVGRWQIHFFGWISTHLPSQIVSS